MKDVMDIKKYRGAKAEEISAKVLELKKALMEARFAQATGAGKDTSVLTKTRHAIAMLNGFLTNKKPAKKEVK